MTDIWRLYDRLVRAKCVLGDVPREGTDTLNDAIDVALVILYDNLDLLAEYIEDTENLHEDST